MAKTKQLVFIVDDDSAHNEMLRKFLLDKFKMEILSFASAEDALRNMHLNPTFVVLDYYLDRTNTGASSGLDVLKQIRQTHPDTFVIVLSSHDKIDVAVDTMKYGAYDYVVKSPSGFMQVENNLNHINTLMRNRRTIKSYRTAVLVLTVLLLVTAGVIFALIQSGVFAGSDGSL